MWRSLGLRRGLRRLTGPRPPTTFRIPCWDSTGHLDTPVDVSGNRDQYCDIIVERAPASAPAEPSPVVSPMAGPSSAPPEPASGSAKRHADASGRTESTPPPYSYADSSDSSRSEVPEADVFDFVVSNLDFFRMFVVHC